MRIKVEGKKSAIINKSTKCSKYEDAYLFAVEEYNRITTAIRLGKGLHTWTFKQHWEDWYQRNVDGGAWRAERANWHEKYYNLYFGKYFTDERTNKSMLLDDIDIDYDSDILNGGLDTGSERKTQKLKYNPKRRGKKNLQPKCKQTSSSKDFANGAKR